jgi:uncharacterized membrane protein YjjP (DUF1212 family)
MAETTPPSGPLAEADGRELRELQRFLLYLGSALTAAGEAVNHVELHLRRVAAAYGAPRARVSVLATYLVVALEPGRPATLEPTRQLRGVLRLDQTAALFELLKAAERGEPSPEEGSHRIRADHGHGQLAARFLSRRLGLTLFASEPAT